MTPAHKRLIQIGAALFGLGLLGVLLWKIGLPGVVRHLYGIGWLAPLVLLPQAGVALCDAQGWRRTLPSALQRLSLLRISLVRLAGEAVNNLTPTANMGGEAVKVYLLRQRGVPGDAGTASVVAAKTALTVSQVAFILVGLPFFLYRLDIGFLAWGIFGGTALLAYGFVLVLVRWQRAGVAERGVTWLRRRVPRLLRQRSADRWQNRAARIDAHLSRLYGRDAGDFAAASLYHFAGWALGAVEVYVLFALMGMDADWVDALIIETMIQPVTAAALVIPGALGVREAGGVYLCRLLGIEDSAGLTLMVLKRAREAVYNAIGLVVLARAGYSLFPKDVS